MKRLAGAVLLAWLGLWFHDAREFEGSFGLTADSIMIGLIAVALVVFASRRPRSRQPWTALLAFGAVMCVGGVLSVLPLPILPYVPAQTLQHYTAHAVYAVAQLPLIALAIFRLRDKGATGSPQGS